MIAWKFFSVHSITFPHHPHFQQIYSRQRLCIFVIISSTEDNPSCDWVKQNRTEASHYNCHFFKKRRCPYNLKDILPCPFRNPDTDWTCSDGKYPTGERHRRVASPRWPHNTVKAFSATRTRVATGDTLSILWCIYLRFHCTFFIHNTLHYPQSRS